jgi:hypothetical protein
MSKTTVSAILASFGLLALASGYYVRQSFKWKTRVYNLARSNLKLASDNEELRFRLRHMLFETKYLRMQANHPELTFSDWLAKYGIPSVEVEREGHND